MLHIISLFHQCSYRLKSATQSRRGMLLHDKKVGKYADLVIKKPDNTSPPNSDPWKVLIKKLDTSSSRSSSSPSIKVTSSDSSNIITDELKCPHFGVCSGCTINGNFTDASIVRRATNFFKTQCDTEIPLKIHLSNPIHWRTNVKLAVQAVSRWGGLKIGLYKSKSHIVEAIPECQVHHPRINEAVEELQLRCIEAGITGYQEAKNGQPPQGELRYIQMTLERLTGKIQLVLVWNAPTFITAGQTLPRLVKKLKLKPELWHSISVNFQTSEGNTIFNYNPKAWKTLWGPQVIKEKIGNVTFYFRPQIFRQANLDMFETGILPLVVSSIPEKSVVSELYSGIGVLGLNTAYKATEVLCSDTNEFVDEVFDSCAESLPKEYQESVFYECMSAGEAVQQGQCLDADVLIVDPPRKGLDKEVLDMLTYTKTSTYTNTNNPIETKFSNKNNYNKKRNTNTNNNNSNENDDEDEDDNDDDENLAPSLKRLIYVSCGYDALENDIKKLLNSNRWKVKSADGFLLFPGTDHIETVVVLDRK